MLAILALWLKGMAISVSQVIIRFRSRTMARPEDARMLGFALASSEPVQVEALQQAWRNEAEATPPFLAICVGYILLGGGGSAFSWILAMFVLARWGHGWAQATARQPHRTFAWIIGVAATAALALLAVMKVVGV